MSLQSDMSKISQSTMNTLNKHKQSLNENNEELHPWQIEFCTRIFNNIDELLDYVEDFYLT